MVIKIEKIAFVTLISSVIIVVLITILSIWIGIFDEDLLWRSVSTVSVIGFASLVVLLATKLIDKRQDKI